MTSLPIGPLQSQMVMKPSYQGGLAKVAFLGGCLSVTGGHGLWGQLHVCMGCKTGQGSLLTPPFPKVEKQRPGSGQDAPGQPQSQRNPGLESAASPQTQAARG